MVDIIKGNSKEPLLACWMAVVWEPFRDNKGMVRKALDDIKDLGFNAVVLDVAGSEDYFARYAGNQASPYVAMQEYISEAGNKIDLKITVFSAWLFGDNWYYMGCRDFPVRHGETIIHPPHVKKPFCEEMFKMWSEKMQELMFEHHEGLLKLFHDNFAYVDDKGENLPFLFSWTDVTVRPSFDREGIERYQIWLKSRYCQIDKFNQAYETKYSDFKDIPPEDYWAGYFESDFKDDYIHWHPGIDDSKNDKILIKKWVDNQLWRKEELTRYFKSMEEKHQKQGNDFYLVPSLQQWKVFFNDAGMMYWWMTLRALDPWEISKHCKEVTFITVPADCYSRPDVYVVSAERSIARSANDGKSSIGGFFLGRYMLEDIYAHISSCEVIGTMLANGTNSLYCYGYNGMDDGGTLFKADWGIRDSLKRGLEWFKEAAPLLKSKQRKKDVAILFPLAMSILEPITEGTDFPHHRMDLLGWYKMLVDMHYMVDFLHPNQIKQGKLKDYFALVLPCDNCYEYMPDKEMEETIAVWVKEGGVILHGPSCQSIPEDLKPYEVIHKQECIDWEENIMPESFYYGKYTGIEPIASYESGGIAIGKKGYGKGDIYSFGFHLGDAYTRIAMKTVSKGTKDSYPVYLLKNNPVYAILKKYKQPGHLVGLGQRGIEIGDFGKMLILVNHSPNPWRIEMSNIKETIFQCPSNERILQPHSAVLIELETECQEEGVR